MGLLGLAGGALRCVIANAVHFFGPLGLGMPSCCRNDVQFKRPQLAVSLQSIMEEASTPAAKQANNNQLVQVIAALSQLPSLKDHVVFPKFA